MALSVFEVKLRDEAKGFIDMEISNMKNILVSIREHERSLDKVEDPYSTNKIKFFNVDKDKTTSLLEDISESSSSLQVTSNSFSFSTPFYILINSEVMEVTKSLGNRLYVDRGKIRTVPATHKKNSIVSVVNIEEIRIRDLFKEYLQLLQEFDLCKRKLNEYIAIVSQYDTKNIL